MAHTRVHTAKDLVGPLMLSHPHIHTGEDREGPLVLQHTDMYTRGWVSCFVTHSALCDETFHSHVRLGNHDTGPHPSHHFLVLNKLKSCNQTVPSTVLSLPRL